MPKHGSLLTLNPALDVSALAKSFASDQRLQIRDILIDEAAIALHQILLSETPWALAWKAKGQPPSLTRTDPRDHPTHGAEQIEKLLADSMGEGGDAFAYMMYPLVTAYLEEWSPGGALAKLLEDLNSSPLLDFVRKVTGISGLVKADGQATLYRPGQFLALHNDYDPSLSRRVAYVLNLCAMDWRPDWGGYLNFFDESGDIVAGFRPRFNALNLFAVPQRHNVSYVPPYAPAERFAVTGWFFDKI
ncbi:MAG: 2OG-Fe(II) oxygenase family protein [Sphingomonas sp.]